MIYYFSATGNSRHVAERIASALNSDTRNIADCLRDQAWSGRPAADEPVGIVFPVYFWGLPSIVREFLSGFLMPPGGYLFTVTTFGMVSGAAARMSDQCLSRHGRAADAHFSVQMPDTWTPVFDLSDPGKVSRMIAASEQQLNEIIPMILRQERGNHARKQMPILLGEAAGLLYRQMSTSGFTVDASCISCGLCEQRCPAEAIRIINGKPKWVKNRCVMCLGCLHRCPKNAIQYGIHTRDHGQYQYPDNEEK